MTVRQVELRRGSTVLVAWVDASLPLRVGVEVTGKDGERWRVAEMYDVRMEQAEINRNWRVGGLS